MRIGKFVLRALVLASLIGAAGCGQPSFFEVTVQVAPVTGVRTDCINSAVFSCELTVSGAASGSYVLGSGVCSPPPRSFTIAQFQYGTDADSGNVTFDMSIFSTQHAKLGEGSVTAAIKAKATQPVTLTIQPDLAAFIATNSCPQ